MQDDFQSSARDTASKRKGIGLKGCLGCLGVLIAIPLVMLAIAYYSLFHTSWPLRQIVESDDFDINGKPAVVEGLSGSISSGFSIDRIVIQDDPHDSVIEGLTFRYSGLWDSMFNNRFVIEQLSADRCDLIVGNDFLDNSDDEDQDDDGEDDDELDDFDDLDDEGLGDFVFELRELDFKNISLKSPDGEIDIQIPLIHLAGLKISGDDISLAELEVNSDLLQVQLADAEPVDVDGQTLPFKQKVVGVVRPKIHPVVTSEIDFSFAFAVVDGTTVSRFEAFDGKVQNIEMPDGRTNIRVTNLKPDDYLDTTGTIIPDDLSFVASETDDTVAIESGDFLLGMTRFTISPQEVDSSDRLATLTAQAEVDGQKVEVTMRPDKDNTWPPVRVEIVEPKGLGFQQQLALIYFHSSYDDLTDEQKSQVDEIVKKRSEEKKK